MGPPHFEHVASSLNPKASVRRRISLAIVLGEALVVLGGELLVERGVLVALALVESIAPALGKIAPFAAGFFEDGVDVALLLLGRLLLAAAARRVIALRCLLAGLIL